MRKCDFPLAVRAVKYKKPTRKERRARCSEMLWRLVREGRLSQYKRSRFMEDFDRGAEVTWQYHENGHQTLTSVFRRETILRAGKKKR